MSPLIRPVPRIAPSYPDGRRAAAGGPISATGFPNRVTMTGWPVLCTSAKTERQVALNLEIGMLRTPTACHGPRDWSIFRTELSAADLSVKLEPVVP
jgi:hypothetical protein